MFEIGTSLREARERQKLELSQVEGATRIRARYLQAFEDERFDILPGVAYAKGFLRTYADYLGLDAQQPPLALGLMPGISGITASTNLRKRSTDAGSRAPEPASESSINWQGNRWTRKRAERQACRWRFCERSPTRRAAAAGVCCPRVSRNAGTATRAEPGSKSSFRPERTTRMG